MKKFLYFILGATLLFGLSFSATQAETKVYTLDISEFSSPTNLFVDAQSVRKITFFTASGTSILTFFDDLTNSLTRTIASTINVTNHQTNFVNTITNSQGIIQTNTFSGTVFVTEGAITSITLPAFSSVVATTTVQVLNVGWNVGFGISVGYTADATIIIESTRTQTPGGP